MICVYGIHNTVTGKWYVGATTRCYYRWQDHLRMLRQKRHHAQKLQASYNKHGETVFEFTILQQCSARSLCRTEQKWLDRLNAYVEGYNTLQKVDKTDPIMQAERTRKRWADPEQRSKQSELMRRIWKNPEFRKAHAAGVSKAQKKRWRKYREERGVT